MSGAETDGWYVVGWWRSGRLVGSVLTVDPQPEAGGALAGCQRVRMLGPVPKKEAEAQYDRLQDMVARER